MSETLLPAIEIETAADPDAAVIWMHGLGDDGRGWSEVVPMLGLPAGLRVRFLFPHAPVMPVTINNGMRMRAWYDIRQANFNERADLEGVRHSQALVAALQAREIARGIEASRMVLAGFSQGGAIALYAGIRYGTRLAGILGLSTYLVDAEHAVAEASAANRDVPIFLAHGTQDPVIHYAWAGHSRDVLRAGGWPVEWHSYAMEHSAVPEELAAAGNFLAGVLAPG
jgi:phospholipase/carboxylesterase